MVASSTIASWTWRRREIVRSAGGAERRPQVAFYGGLQQLPGHSGDMGGVEPVEGQRDDDVDAVPGQLTGPLDHRKRLEEQAAVERDCLNGAGDTDLR